MSKILNIAKNRALKSPIFYEYLLFIVMLFSHGARYGEILPLGWDTPHYIKLFREITENPTDFIKITEGYHFLYFIIFLPLAYLLSPFYTVLVSQFIIVGIILIELEWLVKKMYPHEEQRKIASLLIPSATLPYHGFWQIASSTSMIFLIPAIVFLSHFKERKSREISKSLLLFFLGGLAHLENALFFGGGFLLYVILASVLEKVATKEKIFWLLYGIATLSALAPALLLNIWYHYEEYFTTIFSWGTLSLSIQDPMSFVVVFTFRYSPILFFSALYAIGKLLVHIKNINELIRYILFLILITLFLFVYGLFHYELLQLNIRMFVQRLGIVVPPMTLLLPYCHGISASYERLSAHTPESNLSGLREKIAKTIPELLLISITSAILVAVLFSVLSNIQTWLTNIQYLLRVDYYPALLVNISLLVAAIIFKLRYNAQLSPSHILFIVISIALNILAIPILYPQMIIWNSALMMSTTVASLFLLHGKIPQLAEKVFIITTICLIASTYISTYLVRIPSNLPGAIVICLSTIIVAIAFVVVLEVVRRKMDDKRTRRALELFFVNVIVIGYTLTFVTPYLPLNAYIKIREAKSAWDGPSPLVLYWGGVINSPPAMHVPNVEMYDNWMHAIFGSHKSYGGRIEYFLIGEWTPLEGYHNPMVVFNYHQRLNLSDAFEMPILVVMNFYHAPLPMPPYEEYGIEEIGEGIYRVNSSKLLSYRVNWSMYIMPLTDLYECSGKVLVRERRLSLNEYNFSHAAFLWTPPNGEFKFRTPYISKGESYSLEVHIELGYNPLKNITFTIEAGGCNHSIITNKDATVELSMFAMEDVRSLVMKVDAGCEIEFMVYFKIKVQ